MKKIYKIVIPIIIVISLIICLIVISNKNNIKSIKSEHQLYEFYQNSYYSDFTTLEKIFTLPFSLIVDNRSFSGRYRYYDYDMIAVEESTIKDYNSGTSASTKDYSKTNIQVEDVDEADIIKTDGDYIYSISNNNVIISNVKNPKKVVIESKIYTDSSVPSDLLLYDKYLVIISYDNKSGRWNNQNTLVEIYDISDKKNPKLTKSFELYEPYYTSRCIDGDLYIFSNGYLREENKKVIRKYKEDNKTKEIELNDIKYLKNNPTSKQTLIAHIDLKTLKELKVQSYLIDVTNAYVSKNNIYLLDNTYEDYISIGSIFTYKGVLGFLESSDDYDYDSKTKIYKFEIKKDNGVVFDTVQTIKGKTVNQYSLDEQNNHLRIALETDEGTRIAILNENLKLIGETDKVAEGEKMYSSRFMGDKAYLVTYRNTDPLFVIDLSDEENPKVLGELKIPGYSTYLHPYDENHLIGIGMNTEEIINRDSKGNVTSTWVRTNGMKMALFDVSDVNNPKEISKIKIGDSMTVSAILTNPKALLFSKEKNLLAIPVNNYEEDFSVEFSDNYEEQIDYYIDCDDDYIAEGYFVYNLDLTNGFKLKGIINHEKNHNYYYYGNSKLLRGVYIDNNLYTVSEDYIKVNNLNDLKQISSLKIKE